MARLGSLPFCATLVAGLLACGSNTSSDNGSVGGTGVNGGSGGTGGSGTGGSGGGGTSTDDPVNLVPLDNEVSGWTVDTESNKNGNAQPMTATTQEQAIGLIDGAAAPFYRPPFTPTEFVWQTYLNNSLSAAPQGAQIVLYIWAMPTADQAAALYTALLQESEYSGNWQAMSPTLGTESRIEDTNTAWWINFHKGVYYVEVFLSPSYGPKPDYTPSNPDLKNQAVLFAQAVASKK